MSIPSCYHEGKNIALSACVIVINDAVIILAKIFQKFERNFTKALDILKKAC